MNVLVSAYACAPGKGSEPQAGWNWAREISAQHPAWILTRAKHRPAIERTLAEKPMPNAHFVYVDLPRWARIWKALPAGVYVYYMMWQVLALMRARALQRTVRFDRIHHVTFCMFWMPSFLPLLRIPFVWGPLGGGEFMPREFRRALPLRDRVFESARDVVQRIAMWNPLVRFTARNCEIAIAGTPETADRLRSLGCRDVRLMPVAAITGEDLAEFSRGGAHRSGEVLRLCSAGRLLSWKGFHLALEAIARIAERVPVEYWIFGNGPERARLESMARSLGIGERVHFCEQIARHTLLARLPEFDALLHPSLHDSGGFICLEAMAAGCAMICLDMGGPATMVPPRRELRIPASNTDEAVARLAEAIERLHEDPELRAELGAVCREHVDERLTFAACLEEIDLYASRVEVEA